MTTDTPLTSRFVASPAHWSRKGAPVLAVALHMAEGGGTVSWLSKQTNNSSHYVVQYDGSIVQMVLEAEAAGSMNPNLTRADDDAPYVFEEETIVYGRTALDAAGVSADPNRYCIAIETEGFAKDGPNAMQRHALKLLVADIRERNGALHVLGHRDQQSYKACPGHKMPWADYGGHGAPQEEPMTTITLSAFAAQRDVTGTNVTLWLPDGTTQIVANLVSAANATATIDQDRAPKGSGWLRLSARPYAGWYVAAASVTLGPEPADPTPYSQADVDAAIAADRQNARIVWP